MSVFVRHACADRRRPPLVAFDCAYEGGRRTACCNAGPPIAVAVGAELRRLRLAAGLTREQVALACDSYREIIGRIERGLHAPTLETCALFAAACGGSLLDIARAVDRALGLGEERAA